MSAWKTVAASSILVLACAQGTSAQATDPFGAPFASDSDQAQPTTTVSGWRTPPQVVNAQYVPIPHPVPVFPLVLPPKREIGIHMAGWAFGGASPNSAEPCCDGPSGGTVGLGGATYTRSLTEGAAIETGFDTGRGSGHQFTALTARFVARRYSPAIGEVFVSLGLADAIAARELRYYPRGLGLVVGGGAQPRLTNRLSLRGQVDLLRFQNVLGLRVGIGAFVGFD
jgi:hypothetical protein